MVVTKGDGLSEDKVTLPFDPASSQEKPVSTEESIKARREALSKAKTTKASADESSRVLDIPEVFVINGVDYQYTSRPMGFVRLILNEFLSLAGVFSAIEGSMNDAIEQDRKDMTGEDIQKVFVERGEAGIKVLVTIVQLLLEPVTGGPPNLGSLKVPREDIEWTFSMNEMARLFSVFMRRDVSLAGGAVKNLMGLGQTT